jgi:hypothetical protein
MSSHTLLNERLRQASEVIILGMACLSPWAIGAVDAWAQLILYGGLVIPMILGLLNVGRSGWARRLFCGPSLALAGLAPLALLQAIPLSSGVLKTIAPSTYSWKAGLAPAVPQRVRGDSGPPVRPPASSLSQDPDASLRFDGYYYSHAEDKHLQMLTEGGGVGLVLAFVALVTIGRLGRRALIAAPTSRDRAMVLGALAGGLVLLIQCLSDFPLHIPGVAVTAVVLPAHLCRLGLEARPRETVGETRPARVGPLLGGLAMIGLSVALIVQGTRLARAEALVRSVGLPFSGALMPTIDFARQGDAELNHIRTALEEALRLRPGWAEGHLRLGTTLLGLYSNLAAQWLVKFQEEKNPEAVAILSDPLWLHGVVHSAKAEQLGANGGILDHEPVRDYLVPAARCFLEARRCSPDLAVSHARLAALDYLIAGGETTSVHAARTLRLTGYDQTVLTLAGDTAAQAGDLDLAARCWQKSLRIYQPGWKEIAIAASMVLSPEQILKKVLPPGGHYPLLLADQLSTAPEWRDARKLFLTAALDRLHDDDLSPTERIWIEAQIRARLDERDQARKLMTDALVAGPIHPEWREEFIDWLVSWGDVEEAARQARIGLTLHPDHPGIQRALKSALDAYAKGPATTASQK